MLTLVEAAKLAANAGQAYNSGVIETFARESDLLRVLPFEPIQGNALRYNQEGQLPGVAFRGINESYSESTGVINPQVEPLVIAGGDLDVDTFIVKTQGMAARNTHETMKIKALAAAFTTTLIKGDSNTDPREFDGLQKRITGSQLIAAGSTANGTALSLGKLDEAIDATAGATHIILSKALRRRLQAAARNPSVGGYLTYNKNEFGQRVAFYNDLPLIVAYEDNGGTDPLAFNEACTSGTATGTSLYVVAMGPGKMHGIQSGAGMDITDLGVLQASPKYRTRVEWLAGLCIEHGRAATRLWSIADAAVTL